MLFPADSNRHLPSSSRKIGFAGDVRLPELTGPRLLFRLMLWLLRTLGAEMGAALPVRVYYKFDSGCWRSRNTLQLHKVYRCR